MEGSRGPGVSAAETPKGDAAASSSPMESSSHNNLASNAFHGNSNTLDALAAYSLLAQTQHLSSQGRGSGNNGSSNTPPEAHEKLMRSHSFNSISLNSLSLSRFPEEWSQVANAQKSVNDTITSGSSLLALINNPILQASLGSANLSRLSETFKSQFSVSKNRKQTFNRLPEEWVQNIQNANAEEESPSDQAMTGHNEPTEDVQPSGFVKRKEISTSNGDYNNPHKRKLSGTAIYGSEGSALNSPMPDSFGPAEHKAVKQLMGSSPSHKSLEKQVSNMSALSGDKQSSRWNSWSHDEEVFLVVAVLDRFFRRGSLASQSKGKGQNDCWVDIKTLYDNICVLWMQHLQNEGKPVPELIPRSTTALSRHYKIMKVKAVEGDTNGTRDGNFRKYLREWERVYNVDERLVKDYV